MNNDPSMLMGGNCKNYDAFKKEGAFESLTKTYCFSMIPSFLGGATCQPSQVAWRISYAASQNIADKTSVRIVLRVFPYSN